MKLLHYIITLIAIFFTCTFIYSNNKHMSILSEQSKENKLESTLHEIKMEKAPSPWANFIFDGPGKEAPEDIETINLSGRWIRPIDPQEEGCLLAYRAEVALKKQENDKIHREKNLEWAICNYSVTFHFYLLDENGFCLKNITTSEENCQKFPSFAGTFIEPGKGIDVQQTIIMKCIPTDLVSRIKKIIYLPKFKTCALRASNNLEDEKHKLLKFWKSKLDKLPQKNEWNIFDRITFENYGGDKTNEELNEKAEEIAIQNLANNINDISIKTTNPPFGCYQSNYNH